MVFSWNLATANSMPRIGQSWIRYDAPPDLNIGRLFGIFRQYSPRTPDAKTTDVGTIGFLILTIGSVRQ
jgi:hypothetical protein